MLTGQFRLPIQIDLAATLLFAITGGLAALKRRYDVIGLFALSFVTAAGGGLVRDGLFIQQGPPAVTTDSRYILVILLGALGAFLFREHVTKFNKTIAWLDALGVGAYGVVGIQKSLDAGLSVAAAVFVGVINAAGGGLLRDVLVRDEPLLFKPGQFYALAAFAGCVLYAVLTLQSGLDETRAALIAIALTFAIRMLSIRFNWKSPPLWQDPESNSGGPGPPPR